jgi:heme O synthase-like polyprenyltransferase
MISRADAVVLTEGRRLADFAALTKPRVVTMVLVTTFVASTWARPGRPTGSVSSTR